MHSNGIMKLLAVWRHFVEYVFTALLAFFPFLRVLAPEVDTYNEYYDREFEWASRGLRQWCDNPKDRSYDYKGLRKHYNELRNCRLENDNRGMAARLRSRPSRNAFKILAPALYRRSPIITKRLVQNYIFELHHAIAHLVSREDDNPASVLSMQEKHFLLYSWKRNLGRTALLLQGGAIFSLAHLGVVKELAEQDLLPKIIIGTASGALVAAIVGTSTSDSLLTNLEDVNLRRFEQWAESTPRQFVWEPNARRRMARRRPTGHLLDTEVLIDCIRDNIGEQTFQEAHKRTGRILNITIALPDTVGTPHLLNHVTAPYVLIWSAVAASVATSNQLYAPVTVLCRRLDGSVGPYLAADASGMMPPLNQYRSPLSRIGELFNVNHFIVSQTQPYIIPFVLLQQWADRYLFLRIIVKLTIGEMLYWLRMANIVGLLPTAIRRMFADQQLPTAEPWSKVVISPSLRMSDFWDVFNIPSSQMLEDWTKRGQRATWPFVNEILMRTKIEHDLDSAFTTFVKRPDFPHHES